MSIESKLVTIAENNQKVYNKGKTDEWHNFWDNFQDRGDKTDYENAFRKWADGCYNPKYPIITTSGRTRANSMFNQSSITDTRVDITINSVGTTHVFYNASKLKTIRKLTVNKDVTFGSWFVYAHALENITFDGEIGQNISFADCKKLTHYSLMSVINCLKDYSGGQTTHTLTLGTALQAKLSDEEKAIATEKGWTLA